MLVSELFVTDLQQDEELVLKCPSVMSLRTLFSPVHILFLMRLLNEGSWVLNHILIQALYLALDWSETVELRSIL